ncbi:MAG: hypothetical protein WCT19_04355 [Candidatus Paceibacterota bacterium]|jgi:hypothetical protein
MQREKYTKLISHARYRLNNYKMEKIGLKIWGEIKWKIRKKINGELSREFIEN